MAAGESERELLARARRGGVEGRAAFEALVRRHDAWLVRLLAYVTGSLAEAEDLVQEVFVRTWQELPRLRGRPLRPWLRVVALRMAWNRQRDETTRRHYEERVVDLRFATVSQEAVLARDLILRVLRELPYPYREVLLLRYVEELPYREIAAVLGITEGAARMRLKRARAAFIERQREVGGV